MNFNMQEAIEVLKRTPQMDGCNAMRGKELGMLPR